MILRLGSGEAARRGCGSKATLLDRAARARLPVPSGVLVLDEAWRAAVERGLVRVAGSGARRPVSVPDPSLLVHLIRLPAFSAPLAIRAAFSSEDGAKEALAGSFVPGLFVDGRRPGALAAGLAGVWAAAFRRPRGFRRDVIIQDMVLSRRAGTVLTEREHEDDIADVTEAAAEHPEAGPPPGRSLRLPKLRGGEPPTEPDPVAARLQSLMRGVRRVFGEGDWVVEWADDGTTAWILQLRPARPARRDELFTAAGHREILPDPPSRLTTSLVAASVSGLFGQYRRYDARLPAGRPLVEVLHGRPCLNLSLLTEMVRRWGLPTRLVTDSIGGAADRDFGWQPRRLLRRAPVLARLLWAQLGAVSSSARAERRILERTKSPPSRLVDALEELRWLYTELASETLSLTAALSGPLALLRRAGLRPELARRWRSTASEMLEGLAELGAEASRRSEILDALGRGEVPDDPVFRRSFEAWLERFGHHGVHASDVARPRFREQPGLLLRSLSPPPPLPPSLPRPSLKAALLRPVAWHAERTLRARESLRSSALVGFERLRRVLLDRARALAEDGVLPSVDALFDLDADELRHVDEGFRPEEEFFEDRRAEIAALAARDLPEVFHRLDDPERVSPRVPDPGQGLRGIGLTTGRVEGRAWVLSEPEVVLPPGFSASDTILVTRAVDLGWLPVFSRVAGVVVELGGDLSYGSIVLGEMGLPAVTNVRGVTRALATGDRVALDADRGVVERPEPKPD